MKDIKNIIKDKLQNLQSIIYKKSNYFLGKKPKLINSKIMFYGKGNIIFCENNVKIKNSKIVFYGNNSLIYLSSSKSPYMLDLSIYNNSVCYIGKNNYFNQNVKLIISEEKNVFIGDGCMFSINIWFRVSDAHLIFDSNYKYRTNFSKSIYIGDHVWIGQNAFLLKETKIGSGAIIAANAVVANKTIPSNSIGGGNPCSIVKRDIFWTSTCVHKWENKDINENNKYENEEFIYKKDDKVIDLKLFEEEILAKENNYSKLNYIQTILKENKNRFYIENS